VIEGVLRGDPMADETAVALGAGFGISADFWRNLEADYRDGLAKGRHDAS
jgi:plasmid maintenance system antidote protein VapI